MKTATLPTSDALAADAAHADHLSARKGRVLMLFSVGFFIANTLVVRLLGVHWHVDAWTTTAVRFVVGLALVSLPGMPTGRPAFGKVLTRPLLIARGVMGGIGVFLYYYTVTTLGAGRATVINLTYVVWGALLASVVLRERLRAPVVAALVVGIAGVILLTSSDLSGATMISGDDALALLSAFCAAIVVVIIRQLHRSANTGSIFAAQCMWGLIAVTVPTVLRWETPPALALVLLVVAGLLSGGGQLTMTAAYRHLPVSEGSLFQLLVPVGAFVGGTALFTERHTWTDVLGAILIIAGCLLSIVTRPRLSAGLPARRGVD